MDREEAIALLRANEAELKAAGVERLSILARSRAAMRRRIPMSTS